ncbi:MAG: leucine-rich repeat protein [Anaerorhabdus sp.]
MKIIKIILSLILMMSSQAFTLVNAEDKKEEKAKPTGEPYVFTDGDLSVDQWGYINGSSIDDSEYPEYTKIPSTIDGVTVKGFKGMTKYANHSYVPFAYSNVGSIIVPSTLEVVGEAAFYETYNLNHFIIPSDSKMNKIENNAFRKSGIKEIHIPDSVTWIGLSAFQDSKLRVVSLPSGIKEYAGGIFFNANIEVLTFPSTVEKINQTGDSWKLGAFQKNHLREISFNSDVRLVGNAINEQLAPGVSSTRAIGLNDWYYDKAFTQKAPKMSDITVEKGTTIYGYYEVKITFNSNGGKYTVPGEADPQDQYVIAALGANTNLSDKVHPLTNEDMVVARWEATHDLLPEDGTLVWDMENDEVVYDTTLTPLWGYKVSFVGEDSQLIEEQKVVKGEDAVEPAFENVPFIEDKVFTGWDVQFDNVQNHLTVTAQYAPDINDNGIPDFYSTVKFLDWDKTALIDDQQVLESEAAKAPETDPTRENFVFVGWDKDFSNIQEDTTVTAQYRGIPILSVPEFTEIKTGVKFDIFDNVEVVDIEDNLTINDVKADNTSIDTSKPGFAIINYTVEDSDNNVVNKKRVILVNDGTYSVGSSVIIQAMNFEKMVSEVDTTEQGIIEHSKVKVYNKSGDNVTAESKIVADKGDYTNIPGVYSIKLKADDDAYIEINATVNGGNKPEIESVNPYVIEVGEAFNSLDGFKISDIETAKEDLLIEALGTVDNNKAGVYSQSINVTDKDNQTTNFNRTVVVNDGTFVVGDKYIIHANDFSKRVSEVEKSESVIKSAAGLKVYDIVTGFDFTDIVNVTVDMGTYNAKTGEYDIAFTVTEDKKANTKVKATVTAGELPTLSVPSFTEVEIDDSFDIMTGVTASDVEEGDLILTANPTNVDTSAVGVTKVTYTVKDVDGNEVTATQVVLVNDGTFVVGKNYLLQANDFTKRVSEVDTSDAAVKDAAGLKVYNIATGANVTATKEVTVTNGGYTNAAKD